jgi:hypothetical protein
VVFREPETEVKMKRMRKTTGAERHGSSGALDGRRRLHPEALEAALRSAWVDPNGNVPDDLRDEAKLVLDWFSPGHADTLPLDIRRLTDRARKDGERWANRVRLQWNVSF